MIKYKMKKHSYNYYVLYKYVYIKNSMGFYKVSSGSRKEILEYLKTNNLKVGVKYEWFIN